jgi:hypothetical protein
MRTFVLVIVAAAGALLVNSLGASAVPVNGAAIARVGQPVDPVINAKKKQADINAKKKCFGSQIRDRYGYCVPSYRR